ncbi:MAG: MnmC family methyltransferase [Candidatus Woesearchaeota archaeon]
MKQVKTKDNSITYFNDKYQEHYHSTSGAREEAIKKFVEPCIPYLNDKDEIIILDVCFGIGYNSAAAIDLLSGKFNKITIYGLENDEEILNEILEIKPDFKSYFIIKHFILNKKNNIQINFNKSEILIKIIIGDARETIKQIKDIDVVLFDPFSPKKCPELWTKEFLYNVKNSMRKNSVLTTYSCAKTIRDIMRELGFKVLNGPRIGRKAPSTIAINI